MPGLWLTNQKASPLLTSRQNTDRVTVLSYA